MHNEEKYFNLRINHKYKNQTLEEVFKMFCLSKQKSNYLFANSCCFVNGEIASKDTIVKLGDYLMVDVTNFEQIDYIPEAKPIKVLYEDDYLIIVEKPSGYIIYPDSNDKTGTMANIIAGYFEKTSQNNSIRHCHRLDTETSGCLVYAKDIFTHAKLSKMFEEKTVEKTYLTIVEGLAKNTETITIGIGKDRHNSKKMVATQNGQSAYTKYKLLKTNNFYSFLKVNIKTGRTHQIRVHLSSKKLPIYGDKLYGSTKTSRILLHCYSLKFEHPITSKDMTIVSKLPRDFEKILKKELLTCDLKQILL